MPFYEYECPSCRYYAEVMQKISDAPLKKCPSCGKAGFKRLISAPVFRLKGSGWYETDFKSDKEGKRNLAGPDREDSKPAADGASGGAKTDQPAEAKAATPAPAKADSASATKAERAAPASRTTSRTAARPASARPRKSAARKPARPGRRRK